MEKLFALGCRDVFFTPVFMKKNRPATLLTVLCTADVEEAATRCLFEHTTTIGVRKTRMERTIMERQIERVPTRFGEVEVKCCSYQGIEKRYVEYESAKRLAIVHNCSIDAVVQAVFLDNPTKFAGNKK